MKKRILSLMLAFLMVVSMFPTPAFAADSTDPDAASTEATTTPTTEAATDPPCTTCGQYACSSDHLSWCAACGKDDCGVDHTAPADVQPCDKCGAADCAGHENWCDICKTDNCGKEHVTCDTCGTLDCTAEHKTCDKCGTVDCTADHTNWCEVCQKDACGVDHTTPTDPQPCDKCGAADCAGHENWCDICKTDNCGKEHVTCETCGTVDCTADHTNWCEVCQKDACGVDHTTPTDPQPCDKCGAADCAGHENWCDVCKTDNCGKEHVTCETCGTVDCTAEHTLCDKCGTVDCTADHTNWCAECQKDACGIDHVAEQEEETIEIPACSGAPTCWGEENQLPLPNHADGCARKDYLAAYVTNSTAEAIAADWGNFTVSEQTDVIAMAEAYTSYAEALKALVQWETEPEIPQCDCGITEDIQNHAADCPLYLYWVNVYVVEQSVEEISGQWGTLGKSTRESILAILADHAPEKLEALRAILPDMTVTKEASVSGAKLEVSGDIPAEVSLAAASVAAGNYNAAVLNYVPNTDAILFALDITLYNPDGSKWQPYGNETVTVTLDTETLGLPNGERVRLLHDHEGVIEDLGTHAVTEGILTFTMDKFSTIYAVSITTVAQNALDGVIYFDLNAGDVVITGNEYSGYRFDGTNEAMAVTGTLEDGQSYYVYQSNATNKAQTGLFTTGTAEAPEMRLPQYDRVGNWASFITNNTDIDSDSGVIATWNTRAIAAGRSGTPNKIIVSGHLVCSMVIDNVWSSYQQSNSQSETSGALKFDPSNDAKLTLKFKGDNRFATIYYHANKGQNAEIIFAGEDDSTVTVANLTQNTKYNYWKSAIGADDGTNGSAAGIVINSGYIFAGTNAADDCTAIGGGGNGYGGVTINGGTVTAVVTSSGAAIGGGIGKTSVGGQADVKITGGTVYAYNFSCVSGGYSNTDVAYIPAAAIGGGSSARATCNKSTVTITGGNVFARSVGGTAIGGGSSADNHGGASEIIISGGTVDAASIAGTIGGQEVKAGAAIGGGTGGTNGNGGNCTLTISGTPTIYTGSIGGGKTLNTTGANTIGAATVNISGGTMQGQVIMASGASSDCSFTMTGGTIDNSAALSGTLNTDKDLVFEKDGHTYTFLEENGGAVYVENGVATLSGGTVQNTKATKGGAFYVTGGTFKMNGGKITDSKATQTGGAICVESGTATIADGTIQNVTAPNGGAVYVEVTNSQADVDDFKMTGGTITGFSAAENGGAVCVMGGTAKVGGAITGSTTVTEAQKGGAVYVGGGTFEMTGGSMSECNASVIGGAVCVEKVGDTTGTATVSNGNISNVYAPKGGAIAVNGGSFTMNNGTISDVKATSNGTTIDGLGGAVYVNDGSATVTRGSITGNAIEAEAGSGGGVYVEGGSFTMTGGTMTNFNVTGNGGMVCVTGEGAEATIQGGTITGNLNVDEAANGGAVYVSAGGSFTINGDGNIEDCNATENGGGVYLAGGTFTVQGGSFENCTAAVNGGGVYLGAGTFTMPGGTVKSCSAEKGGGVYLAGGTFDMEGGTFESCRATADGGAVCIMDGTANIKGGTIQGDNNITKLEAVKGGGIYVGGGTLEMENGTIKLCSATDGGAAYITGGFCYMRGGTVSHNHAANGGAMYVVNTPVTYGGLHNLTVESNVATNNGGGMFLHNENENTSITNGVIQNNTAGNFGGGIYHEGAGGTCTVSGTGQIKGNTAKNGGGLYIIGGSTLNVNGGHITENQATGKPVEGVTTAYYHDSNVGVGGGVYVGPGTTVSSSFTMPTGKAAGIYANTAEFAADDLYANINATVLSLPKVDGMDLDGSMKATGWYADYAANDSCFYQDLNSDTVQDSLLELNRFPNTDPQYIAIQRYREAESTDTTPYLVTTNLAPVGGISNRYICLTIGRDIINFGTINITKSGSQSDDQYFVFKVEATDLENDTLDKPVFEVTVKGNSSVEIVRVPFGEYKITEIESWSWRYEAKDGNDSKTVTINNSETPETVTFTNVLDTSVAYDNKQQSSLWLDGNSQSKVNVYGQRQATVQNSQNVLGALFLRKEDAA